MYAIERPSVIGRYTNIRFYARPFHTDDVFSSFRDAASMGARILFAAVPGQRLRPLLFTWMRRKMIEWPSEHGQTAKIRPSDGRGGNEVALGGGVVVRFALITLSGRVMRRSRRLIIRLADGHPGLDLVLAARRTILALARGPT